MSASANNTEQNLAVSNSRTQSGEEEDQFDMDFHVIIDPETNREVPLQSAIGTQIIRNYLECLKNGPESENIVSTKMLWKDPTNSQIPGMAPATAPAAGPTQQKASEPPLTEKQKVERKWQQAAESISCDQFEREDIYDKEKQRGKRLTKGCLIYVQRSNKKWQQAIIYETLKKGKDYFVNTFINCDGRVGRKKNIGIRDIILA